MRPFEYARPATAAQATALLAAGGALALAGGSDLLGLMKDGVETPRRLVDLKGLPEGEIALRPDGTLALGALATLDELARHPAAATAHPALARAVAGVAGPQIRNVATLGGNLCQRPRCWYFRRGFGLLGRLDGRSLVEAGDNRDHAILGNDGPALFVSPSTVAPLLVALGARAVVAGPAGRAPRPLADLYRIPRAEGERELALEPAELVLAVEVPALAGRSAASYEVRQRRTLDWSLATAAVVLTREAGVVTEARVVLGQVAPIPWRAEAAEAALRGRAIDPEVAAQAGEAAVAGARPLAHNAYKIQLARAAVARAVLAAAATPGG